jgi:m7GpppX diphosphatase
MATCYNEIDTHCQGAKLLKQESNRTIYIDDINKKLIVCDSKNIIDATQISDTRLITANDRYKKYSGKAVTDIDITIICPYNESDKIKYGNGTKKVLDETAEMYFTEVYPKIISFDKTWITKLLNKENESQRIIYENDIFVLIPDITMQLNDTIETGILNNMHYLVILKQTDILSIRDLNEKHIEMLSTIDIIGKNIIKDIHNVPVNQIRTYLHYRPSFWHLHIHFDLSGTRNYFAGLDHCHLLHNIIQNIKLCSDYYQKVTLRVLTKD